MIRFDVAPLVTPWRRRVTPAPIARMPVKRPRVAAVGAAEIADEAPGGCGWYASSLDLAQGLELTEVEWIDADLPPHLAAALRFA
jgi:hypothetical protein